MRFRIWAIVGKEVKIKFGIGVFQLLDLLEA
jgi:hypothetical protein